MSKYSRRDSRVVYLPGYGKIGDDRVIEGNYDKYVPSILVRLADNYPGNFTDHDPIDPEAITEVFKVPQLRAKVSKSSKPVEPIAPSSVVVIPVKDLESLKPTKAELDELAQMTQDMGGYPELLLSPPEIVTEPPAITTEPVPILISPLPITVSVEPVVESDNDRSAATRDQAAAVVAKMKKPRR